MKKTIIACLWLSLVIVFFFIGGVTVANNPDNSRWIQNLSEGEGMTVTGFEDSQVELQREGNTVHTLWITYNTTDNTKDLYYRRSTDGGQTWDNKLLIASDYYIDADMLLRRMYVYQNYVHIATKKANSDNYPILAYYRSTNGGQSFEAPQTLFTTNGTEIVYLRLSGDKNKINIAAVHSCHFCGVTQNVHIFHSNDNGVSFEDKEIPEDYTYRTLSHWDVKTEGDNIYFYYYETIGPWYNYDLELYLASSNDNGDSFTNTKLSTSAQSGIDHTFYSMDTGWGYSSKIATDGNTIAVVWAGWNELNESSVFASISHDNGRSFGATKMIAAPINALQTGFETIALNDNGKEVYVSYVKTDSKIFVAKSKDGGVSFSEPYEYTEVRNKYVAGGWQVVLLPNLSGSGAILISAGPRIGYLSPDEDSSSPMLVGNWSLRSSRFVAADIAENGQLHIAYQGGSASLGNGGFTDYDIFYRNIDPNYQSIDVENKALQLGITLNPEDGSGMEQFDNMMIPLKDNMAFSDALTIELLVKSEGDNYGRILTQLSNTTWNAWNPESFQLWTNNYNPEEILCGIVTETGPYVLSANIRKGYWNHVAITYEDNGEGGNFKLYVNGQLANQATATGNLQMDIANWYIGSCEATYVKSSGFEGKVDELRFWDTALSSEIIEERKFSTLNGNEDHLTAYYSFNDVSINGQVFDDSGNGNMGYLMYKEEVVKDVVKDLEVSFTYTQEVAQCYFTPKYVQGERFEWDFGDGMTTSLAHPKHVYEHAGIFEVCLSVFAGSNYDTYCKTVTVEGIDRIHPTIGGNDGGITLYIYGGGFTENSQAILRKEGANDIVAIKNIVEEAGNSLTAVFAFEAEAMGKWDVVVRTGQSEQVLAEAFTLTMAEEPEPWVSYNGGGTILKGRWTPQSITIGNSANVDAYGVLLWVLVPDREDVEFEFINLNIEKPQLAIDNGWEGVMDEMGEYIVVDSLFDQPSGERLYPLYFPYLPAQSSYDISIRVKVDDLTNFAVRTFVSPPFYRSPLSPSVQACIAFAIAKTFVKIGVGFIPGGTCLQSAFSIMSNIVEGNPPTPSSFENIDTRHFGWTIGTALLECGVSLVSLPVGGVLNAITSAVDGSQETEDCKNGFWPSPFSIFQILYYSVGSLDPNEKYGPHGFGAANYIAKHGRLSYKVSFENKSTASASAQEVFIYDTLDVSMLNLEKFTFGAMSFGDTIIYPPPGYTDYTRDVDLRPAKDLIVRVKSSLDKEKGIIQWYFAALVPATMDLPIDPFGGFLPPNINSPEGEGFVSYSVGLKEDLQHNDAVSNQATIVFDTNEPIVTNNHLTTFDLLPPVSTLSMTETSIDSIFTIQFSGSDEGAGIQIYELMVSEDGGEPYTYKRTSESSVVFAGKYGRSYELYSIAIDHVGNKEALSSIPDASVFVTDIEELTMTSKLKVYPNPTKDELFIEIQNQNFAVDKNANIEVYDISGRKIQDIRLEDTDFTSVLHLNIDSLERGVYILTLYTQQGASTTKFVKL